MKRFTKLGTSFLVVLTVVTCLQMAVYAAEDDVINEAEIYLQEQAIAPVQPDNNTTTTPEGTKNPTDISRSPAVAGETRIYLGNDEEPGVLGGEDGAEGIVTLHSPATGMPSMMLPVGICLLALGCIPMLARKWKK